jgi:hypothetical protein
MKILLFILMLASLSCSSEEGDSEMIKGHVYADGKRNPLKQPFSSTSIWNMPIGDGAQYVHAKIQKAEARGMTIDEDLIVLTPDAPKTEIFTNYAGWNREKDRCLKEGELLFAAPIPDTFMVSPANWDGLTPNSGLAVLLNDGRTIKQTQPFSRCEAGKFATSRWIFDDVDLYGDGYYGAHGGSGLSAIGGALRVGELAKEAGPIKHVLKVNLFAKKNLHYDEQTEGFVWPAKRADSYARGNYGTENPDVVKACRMGALLALPPNVYKNLDLETEPAKRIAQALCDYGAYVVDDTAWDVYALVTEWGPAGRVADEFKESWGFEINPEGKNNPWARDMDKIFQNLHVVINNTPVTIGGGGNTRVPLAPLLEE